MENTIILTEDIVRDIFKCGAEWGAWNYANNYFDEPMNEEEVINSYFPRQKEENKVPYTFGHLERVLGWESFCDLTGISYWAKREGFEIKDNEIIYLTEEQIEEYGL